MEDTHVDKFGLRIPEVEFDLVHGWLDLQWVSSEVFDSVRPSKSI